ncbi:MAG: saccharopine dehydrogenase NADP-binding domain-containing protein [Chitinophagales bacterium]|nr:saccharopine dehydrogenase NADP-binding domain-containing protein [Chitinophagales bacterium]
MENRKYDIVLFGATGFTGSLVAEYFAHNVSFKKVKWALAGRNTEKLNAIKNKLIAINPECEQTDILACNSDDLTSLENVTAQTKIIVTTVGPFAIHGEALVQACVNTGTNYCDITGEPEFVKAVLKQHDIAAKEKGIYIINCCGFDSIPADAGTYYTALQLPANETKTIKGFVSTNATFSGGTYASAIGAMATAGKDFSLFSSQKKEAKSESTREKKRIKSSIYFDKELKKWAVPMPVIDPWMVMRTSAYRKEVFGANFEYAQFLSMPNLPAAVGLIGTVGALILGAQIKPVRDLLLQYRKSGEGPNQEERDKSYFKLMFIGESETKKVITKVSGGDPGYTETSKMLSETALTLLENIGKLPIKGGVLTPAGTLGSLLIEKLQSKGIKFEVVE